MGPINYKRLSTVLLLSEQCAVDKQGNVTNLGNAGNQTQGRWVWRRTLPLCFAPPSPFRQWEANVKMPYQRKNLPYPSPRQCVENYRNFNHSGHSAHNISYRKIVESIPKSNWRWMLDFNASRLNRSLAQGAWRQSKKTILFALTKQKLAIQQSEKDMGPQLDPMRRSSSTYFNPLVLIHIHHFYEVKCSLIEWQNVLLYLKREISYQVWLISKRENRQVIFFIKPG